MLRSSFKPIHSSIQACSKASVWNSISHRNLSSIAAYQGEVPLSRAIVIPNRRFLRVKGKDTRKFLQGLCTNDIARWDGQLPLATAFLTAKGRILADSMIYPILADPNQLESTEVLLEFNEASAETMAKYLRTYKLRAAVAIEPAMDLSVVIFPNLESVTQQFPEAKTVVSVADPRASGLPLRSVLSSPVALEANEADRAHYKRLRLLYGIPEGSELFDQIPLEVNLDFLNYINFKKGCYIGQELTARTKFKGLVRKRFIPFIVSESGPATFAPLAASDLSSLVSSPAILQSSYGEGDEICVTEADGSVTAVGKLAAFDGRVGIAMLRLQYLFTEQPMTFLLRSISSPSAQLQRIVLFKPSWWPEIDPETGKVVSDGTAAQ